MPTSPPIKTGPIVVVNIRDSRGKTNLLYSTIVSTLALGADNAIHGAAIGATAYALVGALSVRPGWRSLAARQAMRTGALAISPMWAAPALLLPLHNAADHVGAHDVSFIVPFLGAVFYTASPLSKAHPEAFALSMVAIAVSTHFDVLPRRATNTKDTGTENGVLRKYSAIEHDPSLFVSLTTVQRMISLQVLEKWRGLWDRSKTGQSLRAIDKSPPSLRLSALYSSSSLSRKTITVISRLRTGPSYLNAHRHKSGFVQSPACEACGEPFETRAHYLLQCPVLEPFRQPLHDAARSAGHFGSLHVSTLLTEHKTLKALGAFIEASARFDGSQSTLSSA
ncbi:hypothetical protein B0H16DRAFT_1879724 [Mycena metata]|uniref:Reverse transcriptase zinc-binding domain-containing protein n=1 Tax=Mycena metata TaxID=1033252 RepID=A0AAD7K1T8_9AGAR|nr:hypothetical protein B0H16DRAFT_1879724 [Mycena metata]